MGKARSKTLTTAWMSLVAGAILVAGCEKPAPPPPPPPPPPPSAPPPPEEIDTEAMVQSMGVDARVQFPNTASTTSEPLARAIISLCDALARGDGTQMRSMLDGSGKRVLDELESSGAWAESTGKIEAVRITSVSAGEDAMPAADVTMAIQEPAAAYQLRWHATPSGSEYIFSPMEADGRIASRAGDFDGSSGAVDTSAFTIPNETPDEEPAPGDTGPAPEVGS